MGLLLDGNDSRTTIGCFLSHSLAVVVWTGVRVKCVSEVHKLRKGGPYQPMSNFRIALNLSGGRPFVKMSAFCRSVGMYLATTPLASPMWERKK